MNNANRVWQMAYISGHRPVGGVLRGARDGPNRRRIRAGASLVYEKPTSMRTPLERLELKPATTPHT